MLISHTTYLTSDDCNHSFHIDVGPDSGSEGFSLGEREMLAAQLLKPLSVFGDSPVCVWLGGWAHLPPQKPKV